MGESPKVIYEPRPDATPEREISALASAYQLILRSHVEKKKGARPGTPEDGVKEDQHAHTAKGSVRP